MTTTKQIPISQTLWEEIIELKGSNQTLDDLLSHMIDLEKKNRLMEDMKKKENEGEYVEMTFES